MRKVIAALRMIFLIGSFALVLYLVVKGPIIGEGPWAGNWLGLLALLLAVFSVATSFLLVFFAMLGEPRVPWAGFFYWISTIFRGEPGIYRIGPDGITPVRPRGPLGALFVRLGVSGIVVIENGAAAVFERSGKLTRVCGPGTVRTHYFERPVEVVDLRPQVRSRAVKGIVTRDGVLFDVESMQILFQAATVFAPHRGEYVFSEEAVLDLVYRGGALYDKGQKVDWGDRVAGVVEYVLRSVATEYTIAELLRFDQQRTRRDLLMEVEEQARLSLLVIGLRLIGVDVGSILVTQEYLGVLSVSPQEIPWQQSPPTPSDDGAETHGGLRQVAGASHAGKHLDRGLDYSRGLLKLRHLLAEQCPALIGELQVYEIRLKENLGREMRYGSGEGIRSDRAQILDSITSLIERAGLEVSFGELCSDE